jgi:sterol desaturase/sphingolipid hydroxylase (fatty acid hydroxylase superfamily)
VRFHPAEILLSLGLKGVAVVAVGAPVAAVILFEVLLNASSMFNHGNVRLPGWLERRLRWILVTPDMHRIHHSIHREETDSNFGFNFSWWDRVLGTYRAQPRDGHDRMTIGIDQFRSVEELALLRMLVQPVRSPRQGPPRSAELQVHDGHEEKSDEHEG